MARIRSIKPEYWEDELVGRLTLAARLLFIACWNFADDEGRLRWTPELLKAHVFPFDSDLDRNAVQNLMIELERVGMVFPYEGGRADQHLALIVNFAKHQRLDRPMPSKLPPPGGAAWEEELLGRRARRHDHD